jgi:pectate lyase
MKLTLFGAALAAMAPVASLAAPVIARQSKGPIGYASMSTEKFYASQEPLINPLTLSPDGGTTGGAGGSEVTVKTVQELMDAVKGDEPSIIWVEGTLDGYIDKVRVGSNKSILGKNSESKIIGAGLFIKEAKNVIVQNLAISKVSEGEGDAIGVQKSENIWIDHCDLSSDLDNGKDYYDGLADFSHGVDYVTVR